MVLALNIAWFTIQKKKYLVKYFAKKKMRFLSKAYQGEIPTINNQNMAIKLPGNNTRYES